MGIIFWFDQIYVAFILCLLYNEYHIVGHFCGIFKKNFIHRIKKIYTQKLKKFCIVDTFFWIDPQIIKPTKITHRTAVLLTHSLHYLPQAMNYLSSLSPSLYSHRVSMHDSLCVVWHQMISPSPIPMIQECLISLDLILPPPKLLATLPLAIFSNK